MADLSSFLGISGLGGGTIGRALVELQLDSRKYSGQLAAAEAETKSATSSMGAGTSRFAGIAGNAYVIAGAAAVGFAVKAVQAASDQNEALNKSRVIFGAASADVEAFAETSAESFGISKTAALEAAAGFGNMLETAGLAEDAAADMSIRLVKLAADLASFNNIDPAEALEKLRSGLAGEAEPLRQVGILLSESRVKAEAYASGIAKAGAELTEAQKVQARFNLILKDSESAQGDFARTSDGLANQLRSLKARFDDIVATVGQDLLPVAEALVGVLGEIASVAGPVIDFFHTAGSAAGEWADQIARLFGGGKVSIQTLEYVGTLKELRHAFDDTGDGANDAGKKVKRFAGLSKTALADFKDDVEESVQVSIGQFESLNDAFSVTPAELKKQLDLAVRIAKREQADLAAIFADKSLTAKQKEALAELPPEYRRAFVESGKAAREELAKQAVSLKNTNAKTFQEITSDGKTRGRSGGQQVGRSFTDGLVAGIKSGQGYVASAAAAAVEAAIQAARDAAEAQSPSKKMERLGAELMLGLQAGLTSRDDEVIADMREIIDNLVEEAEKRIQAAQDRLSSLRGRAGDFRSTIAGGFDQFLDFSDVFGATSFGDVLSFGQKQLSGAKQLADVLEALKRQGATRGLLQQVVGAGDQAIGFGQTILQGGPQGIQQLNQIFSSILDVQDKESGALTKDFFGEKIDRVLDRLEELQEIRRVLQHPMRFTPDFRAGMTDFERWVLSIIANATMRRVPV